MTLSGSDWALLHREMDGEATDVESAGLRERLAAEPELRAAFQALAGVGESLSEVGLVDPPPELAPNVMRQVRRGPGAAPRGSWLAPLSGWVTRQPALALAATLAVGLLGGLLVTSLSDRGSGPLDEAAVSGTLLPPGDLAERCRWWTRRASRGPGIDATAVTRSGHGVVVAELDILSGGPVDVTVEVAGGGLRPRGFDCAGDQPTAGVVIEARRVHVRGLGTGRCFVSLAALEGDPGPVAVRILVEAGNERSEAVLRAGTTAE